MRKDGTLNVLSSHSSQTKGRGSNNRNWYPEQNWLPYTQFTPQRSILDSRIPRAREDSYGTFKRRPFLHRGSLYSLDILRELRYRSYVTDLSRISVGVDWGFGLRLDGGRKWTV